jgi:hypothetical protein
MSVDETCKYGALCIIYGEPMTRSRATQTIREVDIKHPMYNCLTAIIDLGSLSMTPSKYPAINLGAVNIVNISANN